MRKVATILSMLLVASTPALAAPATGNASSSNKATAVRPASSRTATPARTVGTAPAKGTAARATGARGTSARATTAKASSTKAPAPRRTPGKTPTAVSRTGPRAASGSRSAPARVAVKKSRQGAPALARASFPRGRAALCVTHRPTPVPAISAVAESSPDHLHLASGSALIVDQRQNAVLYEKNSETRLPIASITKLMTAMVVLDARLPLEETLEVTDEDVDWLKGSRSRLPLGTQLTRHELLYLALVSSDNRAASALGRTYPGGKPEFVAAMNRKARALGMVDSRFADPTGLNPANTSTAQDLVRMVKAAYAYPTIRQVTTTPQYTLALPEDSGSLEFRNTNRLVRAEDWDIGLSKTGYINEAGRCLVMQADIAQRPLLIVLLNGDGRYTPFADVVRLRDWLQRRQHISSLPSAPTTRSLG